MDAISSPRMWYWNDTLHMSNTTNIGDRVRVLFLSCEIRHQARKASVAGRMLPVAHEASCDSLSWNVQVSCLGPNAFVEFVLFDAAEDAKIRTCSWCDSSDFGKGSSS